MSEWIYIIASVFLVSLISFVGIITLAIKIEKLKKILLYLVSFSAGALFAGAFIHLLPEAIKEFGAERNIWLYLLFGIIAFFVMEKIIHWRHCHVYSCEEHPHTLGYMNLLGDGVHNFVDGLIIAGSYLVSIPLGIATTIAIILHEIPQEMGDFGVLLYAGMSRGKAIAMNFLTALTAVVGAIVGIIISGFFENVGVFLLPFAAGGFIYIAGSDLIPELKKETALKKSVLQLVAILLGIMAMYSLVFLE